MINRRTLIAASGAAALAGPAHAQAGYPRKAIQMIVAFPAGGSTDIGARIVAAAAEKELGQPVVVVNKVGAGGQLGFTESARARPDGYTLAFINLPAVNTIVLDPERKAVFGVDAYLPVINQVLDPGLIWVRAESPFKTFADLIDAAKKAPGKVSACTTGILSDDHLAILMTNEAAKVDFRIVHFDGSPQQLTGVLGGHVDVAFDNVGGSTIRWSRPRRSARPSPTASAPSSCPMCPRPRSWAIPRSSPPRPAASPSRRARPRRSSPPSRPRSRRRWPTPTT